MSQLENLDRLRQLFNRRDRSSSLLLQTLGKDQQEIEFKVIVGYAVSSEVSPIVRGGAPPEVFTGRDFP